MYIAWLQFGTENYGKEQQSSKITHLFDGERVFSSGGLRISTRDLETNGDYRVRVKVSARLRTGWFRWPWDRTAALGRASFIFLP